MELAAVVVVPGNAILSSIPEVESHTPLWNSRLPILGNDVLRSWSDRIRKLGVQNLWLTSGGDDLSQTFYSLARLAKEGVDRLLMVNLKSYAEMDLSDLVRFHCESRNAVTETTDSRGPLGVSILDRLALELAAEKSKSCQVAEDTIRPAYQFRGYAKRILSAKERQELVKDALTGACEMRPRGGIQIRENVWVAQGASVAVTARLMGPSYIGANTIIRPGATIGPFASVERDCVVDCGTTVERSTILPNTYLAPGLLFRNALVEGGYMQDLTCEAVVGLESGGLASKLQPSEVRRSTFDGIADIFSGAGNSSWDVAPQAASVSQSWSQVQL